MSDVFVSYSNLDRAAVRPFVNILRELRIDTFFDVDRIEPGENWSRAIQSALANCRCVIVCWTPNSVVSPEVIEEALQAKQRGIFVPIMLTQCALPYGFASTSSRDLRGWSGKLDQPEWLSVLGDIGRHLSRPSIVEWAQIKARIERNEELAASAAQLRQWRRDNPHDPSAPDAATMSETFALQLDAAERKHAEKIASERHAAARTEQQKLRSLAQDEVRERRATLRRLRQKTAGFALRSAFFILGPPLLGVTIALTMALKLAWNTRSYEWQEYVFLIPPGVSGPDGGQFVESSLADRIGSAFTYYGVFVHGLVVMIPCYVLAIVVLVALRFWRGERVALNYLLATVVAWSLAFTTIIGSNVLARMLPGLFGFLDPLTG